MRHSVPPKELRAPVKFIHQGKIIDGYIRSPADDFGDRARVTFEPKDEPNTICGITLYKDQIIRGNDLKEDE